MHEEMGITPELTDVEVGKQWVREMWIEAAKARADMLTARGIPTDWRDVLHEIALAQDEVKQMLEKESRGNQDSDSETLGQ